MTRQRRAVAGFAAAAAVIAMCFPLAPTARADETIKIGVLLIDGGSLAGLRDTQKNAVMLAIDDINAQGGAAGKMFEADFITYSGTPDAAVDAATRAVKKDGALFVTGMTTSSASGAIEARLASLNTLMIEAFGRSDSLTGKACSKNYFRINENDSMVMSAIGEFLKGRAIKEWDTLSADYTTGRDSAAKFAALAGSQGGKVVNSLFSPPGASDFGAKISQLQSSSSEGLYVTIFGSDAINFTKQQDQFGLFKKYKMVIGNSFIIPQTIGAQGKSALGVYETLGFMPHLPGPKAQAFVKTYKTRFHGEEPGFTSADQYVAIQFAAEAIRQAKSTDIDAVRLALSTLKMDTLLGSVEMRPGDHQAIRAISINEVVATKDGGVDFEVKKILPGTEIMPPLDPACKM